MTQFTITPQGPATLTIHERVTLLRQALAVREDGLDRVELAQALLSLTEDADVVSLLREAPAEPELAYRRWLTLGRALEGLENLAEAQEAFSEAVKTARSLREHSIALSELATVCSSRGQKKGAQKLLEEALGEDALTPYAFARLANLILELGKPTELLDCTGAWLANGYAMSSILAGRYMALLALKRSDEAEHLAGLEEHVIWEDLPAPQGWASMDAFNAELARELLAHTGARRPRSARAAPERLRIDDLWLDRSRLFPVLLELLNREVVRRALERTPPEHVWSGARPESGLLRTWSAVTWEGGFDDWHIHPPAWLSGVYYLGLPDDIAASAGKAGCIELGMPQRPYLEAAAGRRRLFKPHGGGLLTFPSHVYHRTYPTHASTRRIAIAFDVSFPGPDHARF